MKTILIVDDDEDIIVLVKNRLKMNNYNVIFANNGGDGIKKAIEEKPDLILMDVMMPKMSGGEAVRTLKTFENTQKIPVLFLTAMNMNSTISEASDMETINVGGNFYPAIAKPFEPEKLLSTIRLLLRE